MKTPLRSTVRALRVALPALAVVACGGESGGTVVSTPEPAPVAAEPATVLTAVLLDGIVEGARYESGHLSGLTDANGLFRYVEGEPVRISVGGIELGEAHPVPGGAALAHLAAGHVLTPLELAGAGDDTANAGAVDRVRLLMALDDDGDARNGIRIARAIDEALTGATTPGFGTDADFETDVPLAAVLATVADVRGERPVLASAVAARVHLCESLARSDCAIPSSVDGASATDEIDVPALGAGTPDIEEPVVERPVAETPEVDEPIVRNPTSEEPGIETPVSGEPVVGEPVIEESIGEEPVVEKPIAEQPVAEQPVVEESVVEEPVVEKPVVEKPIVEEPAAEEPVVEEPANAAPRLDGKAPARAAVGEEWRFAVTADDDGDALTFALAGAPAWMQLDTASGVLSGTPSPDDVGTTSAIVLSASDAMDTTALPAFAVEVYQPNRAPELAGTPPAAIDVGASYDFVPEASDADGDELYFTAIGLPAWAAIDPLTGALSGTPGEADVGAASGISIRAIDGEATATLGPFDIGVVQPNRAPEIDGWTPSGVLAGETFSFAPQASDADGDTLSWTATNLPAWLALDTASGALEGVAVEGGTASGVTLVASDGEASTTLGPFDVAVLAGTDLARTATASQGSTYRASYPASAAIDGTDSTFNHTLCSAGTRWLQVDLGRQAILSRLVVVNRVGSNRQRLDGASVHVGDLPRAAGSFDDAAFPEARVATLDASARREIVLDAPRRARYVTIETPGDCLHVASLEVHGRYPDEPAFADEFLTFGAVPPVAAGDVVGTVAAVDAQGDPIAWRIDGDAPFAIDAAGTVTATRVLEHNVVQRHDFRVVASDGRHEASVPVAVRLLGRAGARVERWKELSGNSVASLTESPRFDEVPDEIGVLPGLEQPGVAHGSYGERLTALLRVSESGDYVFAVTGDDAASLSLSPTDDPALARAIASSATWRTFRNYAGGGKSATVRLEAGRVHAIEVLHKEGGGSDHVSVGWRRAEDSEFVKLPDALVHVGWLDAASSRPEVAEHVAEHLLERDATVGRPIVDLDATDGQGDALDFAVVGDAPFAVDADGRVTVASALEPGRVYTFDVTIDDGTHTVTRSLTVETTAEDAVERALADGDASGVTEREIVDALAATRDRVDAEHVAALDALFGRGDPARATGPLDWNPTHDSAVLDPLALAGVQPVLISNHSFKSDGTVEDTLALAGADASGARLLLFGGNPIHALNKGGNRGGTANAAMQTFMENAVAWLADRDDPDGIDVVLAHLQDSYWGRHDDSAHGWFADTYPAASVNAEDACESAALAGCLADADLLVIGNQTDANDDHGVPFDAAAVLRAVRDARSRGVAVMFVRNGYAQTALDRALMPELGITSAYNYWRQEGLVGHVPNAGADDGALARLVDAVEALDGTRADGTAAAALDVDYAANDVCTNYVGRLTCHESRALDGDGVSLAERIGLSREALRTRLKALDRAGRNLFSLDDGYRADKLAVLLGDKYRGAVRFPLDKLASDPHAFQRARFADAAVHYARPNNVPQPDMGRFTDAQQALHDGLTATRAFTRTPTRHDEWTSTGAYVPPGRPVVVTRTDASSVEVLVRANMLRGTTRIWNANGYDRPSGLTSHALAVPVGGSVTLSSPHGGPLYVWTKKVAADHEDAGVPVTLSFAGVLDNPLLDAFDEASVVAFSDAMMTTDSDWVDIRTPFAEIHSLKSHVTTAFARQDGDASNGYTTADVLDYVDDLNGYLIKGNYEYAGFSSASLAPLGASVVDWCAANLLTSVDYGGETVNLCTDERIHALPRIQHVNAEIVAACGGLCSGNPFDTGSPVAPLGWGENHEMGHNLQRNRIKIYGGRSGEVSNNIFPLRTSREHAIAEGLARHPSQTRPNHRVAFQLLQAAIAAGLPADDGHPLWAGTGTYDMAFERLSFFIQLVYASGEWDFYTKVYLAERILDDATRSAATDESKWLAVRSSVGMDGYTAAEAKAIPGNDFLYLMASNVDGTDYADWFAAWGVEVSAEAKAQIVANGIVDAEPVVFRYVDGTLPVARPTGTIPLDGTSVWADPEG